MKLKAISAALVIAGSILLPGSAAHAVTLNPPADAFVISWLPTYNNGINGVVISAGVNASGEIRSFLQFDLTTVTNVGSAILYLYNNSGTGTAPTIGVYETSNSWTETGVNWNNQPSVLGSPVDHTVAAAGWYAWDVTSFAQDNVGGQFSLTLRGTGGARSFASNESSPIANRPRLEVAPIPEPSEWTMLLIGLGVIGFMARRRRTMS
jgi:hyaluronate lyase